MSKKPIIIVSGEPYSVFLEIFFKSIKKTKFKRPIILIASKRLVIKQMLKLKFNFNINLITENKIDFASLNNYQINLINVNFKFKKTFDKIGSVWRRSTMPETICNGFNNKSLSIFNSFILNRSSNSRVGRSCL